MWQQVVPALDARRTPRASPAGSRSPAASSSPPRRPPRPAACPTRRRPARTDLDHAVAAQLHQRISRLGKKLPTPFDLDDLIVDDDTRAALVEIAAAARERRKIRDQLQAARRAGHLGAVLRPPRRRQDDVGHRAREAARPRHLRDRSLAGRVEVARRDREEPVRRVRRRRARPRRAAVQRGRLAVRQAHVATSRAATIATRTSRRTTCCSGSSGSTASRS